MSLGSTISSVLIRIKGDGSDAEKALDGVADEARKTEKALDEAAEGGDKMGMAMGAAAGAAAALAIAAAGVTTAVNAYIESNQEASDTMAGLSSRMNDVLVTFGEAIFESEGFQEMLGRLAQVMGLVSQNADLIASVVSGTLMVAIDTAIAVVDGFHGAVAGVKTIVIAGEAALDAMATVIVNLGSRMRIVGNAVLDFGLAIARGVTGTMADAIEMAQDFVEGLAPVARFAGIDLSAISTGLGNMRDGLQANVTQLEAMRDNLRDSTQYQRDLIEANNQALGMRQAERVDEIVQVYDELDQAITSTASSQRGFNFELTETGRRQREVATATAAATAAIQEQGTFWSTMQSGIATAREQAQLAMDKETLSRTAAMEAMKAEVRAGAELRGELDILNGSMPEWSASMNASLDSIATQFSPLNQAMGVFKDGAGAMAEGVATSFVNAALSGEKVGKAFKKQMGDMLVAQGSASIMQGVLSLIPFMPSFNPAGGAAYIAQGGIMLAAGKLMTGGKGGGGGQGLAATGAGVVPTPSTPSVNNNSNVTVNNAFGIVGDQRQSARLVVDSLRFAQAEGL